MYNLRGGGCYQLNHVLQSEGNPNLFMDITLLTQEIIDEKGQLDLKVSKLIKEHDQFEHLKGKGVKKYRETYLNFDEIRDNLTGFARIVYYKTLSGDPTSDDAQLEMVVEGQFLEGLMHGYCRGISAVNGSCSVGYHHNGLPQGKFSSYRLDGTFATQEGIYEGKKCTQPLEIKTFE